MLHQLSQPSINAGDGKIKQLKRINVRFIDMQPPDRLHTLPRSPFASQVNVGSHVKATSIVMVIPTEPVGRLEILNRTAMIQFHMR